MTEKPIVGKVGIIGLGDMGGAVATTLLNHGYQIAVYNRNPGRYAPFKDQENVYIATDYKDLARKLDGNPIENKVIMFFLPAGQQITEREVLQMSAFLRKGDIILDGANMAYQDSIRLCGILEEKCGASYLDLGFGGGPTDIRNGNITLMVGGNEDAFKQSESILKAITANSVYGRVGPIGSGMKAKFILNRMFYGNFAVDAECSATLIEMGKQDPNLNVAEAFRLLAKSPPVTTTIPRAICEAYTKGELAEGSVPIVKPSDFVISGGKALETILGIELKVTNAILGLYSSMSDTTKRLFVAAKEVATGHRK